MKTLKKWMADVDVFLNEEWPALGDSEALEKQLEQCTVRNLHIKWNLMFSASSLEDVCDQKKKKKSKKKVLKCSKGGKIY